MEKKCDSCGKEIKPGAEAIDIVSVSNVAPASTASTLKFFEYWTLCQDCEKKLVRLMNEVKNNIISKEK